jgi:DNA-directed RNA polymerase subunit RPC12/RpoP
MIRIEVICRRCGKKAPADEFKVDHIYKLAVCKVCYNGRIKEIPKNIERKPEERTLRSIIDERVKNKPYENRTRETGTNKTTPSTISNKISTPEKKDSKDYEIKRSKIFDDDDAYLEKAVRKKQEELKTRKENSIRVRHLKDNKVLYPCPSCDYKFKYDIETQRPVKCPYCGKTVNHNINF